MRFKKNRYEIKYMCFYIREKYSKFKESMLPTLLQPEEKLKGQLSASISF